MRLFIFPDSRAQFLTLVDHAGLLPELNEKLGWSASEVDFWSYVNELEVVGENAKKPETEPAAETKKGTDGDVPAGTEA